jgi:hypothetical protein
MKQTNYVIVVDFEEGNNYLQDQLLLGWNSIYDWYDTDTSGDELINTDGSIKQNQFGLIEIDSLTMIYGSDESGLSDLQDHCQGGNKEGLNCILCKIVKDSNDEWIVVPV